MGSQRKGKSRDFLEKTQKILTKQLLEYYIGF